MTTRCDLCYKEHGETSGSYRVAYMRSDKTFSPGLYMPRLAYEEKQKLGLTKGQIIVFGTDGIWEAHNAKGDIFGKEALFEIIRQYAESSSKQIVAAIIDALNRFRQDAIPEDDVTLVVVKVVT